MEPSAVSPRRLVGPGVTFIKRLIRRAVRWYVAPQLAELREQTLQLDEKAQLLEEHLLHLRARVGHETARLHGHLAQLEAQRADTQTSFLAQLVELQADINRLEAQRAETQASSLAQLAELRAEINRLEAQRAETQASSLAQLAELRAEINRLEAQRADTQASSLAQLAELRAEVNQHGDVQAEHLRGLAQCQEQLSEHQRQLSGQHQQLMARCARMERHVFTRPYINPEFAAARPDADAPAFDYHGFEQKFRGPSKLIRDKLAAYVPYFEGCANVLDVGCGRGEFLEALREVGRHGTGMDSDPQQVAECRRKGLAVVEADLFDYLEGLPDESLGGIFCAQVIEHLRMSDLDRFFKLARRKLGPSGVLVAETVNPHCLAAFRLFYLDPTHVAPLFPEVVQFVAESAAFTDVGICYPTDSPDAYHECGEYAVVARKAAEGRRPS